MTDRTRLWVLAALLLIPALLLFSPVLTGQRLFWETLHYYFFQAQQFLTWNLGGLPTWWPGYFSGYPISLTLNGFLNPLFLIVLKFVPVIPAYNVLTLTFFVATLWSTYALARAFGMSRSAAVIAATAFGYSGIVVEWTDVIVFTTLYPVLPLSFLACLKIHQGKLRWRWIWAGLLAYAWIGGFSEILVYFLVGVGTFCLVLLFMMPAHAGSRWRSAPVVTAWSFLRTLLRLYALPVFASLLIVSPWLVSILYFIVSTSNRAGGMTIETASTAQLSISHFIHLFLPRLLVPYGDNIPLLRLGSVDYLLYVGTVPLLLLILSPFLRGSEPRWIRRFFVGLLAFGLLISWRSPVYLIMHALPVLRWFSQHSKWDYLTVLSASMLAGFAADTVLNGVLHKREAVRRGVKILIGAFTIAAACVAAVTIFAGPLEHTFFREAQQRYHDVAASQNQSLPRSAAYYDDILRTISHAFITSFSFRDGWTLVMFLLWAVALAALAIPLFGPKRPYGVRAGILIGATILGSTIPWIGDGFFQGASVSYLKEQPATAAWLHAHNAYQGIPIEATQGSTHVPYRIFTYIPEQTYAYINETYGISIANQNMLWFVRELLENNTNVWFGVDGSFNHEPLADQSILDLRREILGATGTTSTRQFQEQINRFSSDRVGQLLGLWNVKYVLTPLEPGGKWKEVFKTTVTDANVEIRIFENPWFKPRWYFAETVRYVRGDARTMSPAELLRIPTDLSHETLIDPASDTESLPAATPSPDDRLSLVRYTAGRLTLASHTASSRWIVFAESAIPFWHVEIDGRKAPLARANTAFLAVAVPPGDHEVTFRYAGFWEQARISTIGMLNRIGIRVPTK